LGSQPEDGLIKKAETCRCYGFLLSFNCTHIIYVVSDCTIISILLIIENTTGMSHLKINDLLLSSNIFLLFRHSLIKLVCSLFEGKSMWIQSCGTCNSNTELEYFTRLLKLELPTVAFRYALG